jgi:hypothetical protein
MNLEQLKEWQKSGRNESLAAQMAPETVNAENRTVDVIWFTGIDVQRYSYMEGPYLLKFDPKGADLSLLNSGAPVLDDHVDYEGAEGQKGVVEKAWVDGSNYKATLRFSKRPEIDGLWQDIQDKIVQKFSMGVELLEITDTRDTNGQLMTRTATKWRPYELSIAPLPADFGTTTLSSAQPLEATTTEPESVPDEQTNGAQAHKETTMSETLNNGVAQDAPATPPVVDEAKLRNEVKAEERLRAKTIRDRVAAAKLKSDFADALVAEDITAELASERIFAELAKQDAKQPETRAQVAVTSDKGDKIRETMSATLLYRYEPQRYKDQATAAREWTGYSLMEMSRECLREKGIALSGKGPSEVAQLALSTSDLPNILENVANKTLRAGYELYPNTFQAFCKRATVRDFKTVSRTQLSGAPTLLKVNENGEIEQGSLTDGKETYSIASYARILNITRQTIINDDLSALTRVPEMMGRKAAVLEGDIVWGKVTANANMADGQAIFSAAHGNIDTSGGAPTAATVGVGAKKMTLQTGLEGDTLNLNPRYLAAPINLRLTVESLLIPHMVLTVTNGTAPSVVPQPGWIGALSPIFEPRLDTADNTGWYLFADPGQVDTLEYAYLEGQEGMYFETRMGFEVDGIQMKARHDFGAGVLDYRGLYLNDGE